MQLAGERHKDQIHGVQHELDRHEDDDDVAADQHADRADAEQHGPEDQIPIDRDDRHCNVRFANTTAPMIATSNNTEVTSKANRKRVNRVCARSSVLPKLADTAAAIPVPPVATG